MCPDYGNRLQNQQHRKNARKEERKKINNSKIAKLRMVSVNFKELQGRGTLLRCKDDFLKVKI